MDSAQLDNLLGTFYTGVGLPVVGLGLMRLLLGGWPFGFGSGSGLTLWWQIAVGALVPRCLGCLVVLGFLVLTSRRERRLAGTLCLWVGIAATACLGVWLLPYFVLFFRILSRGYLPVDLMMLLLLGGPPTVGVIAWRLLRRDCGPDHCPNAVCR